jgi:4-methylaminobutanoate oxidase (formaldehyde-forming)
MLERARAVVIGGGITGASVAYHLARAGWTDIVLVDKGELTSGSTCHAAGLVTMFNPSPTMMRFRRYSIELYNELGVFETVGSVRFASTPESLRELQRGVSRARGIDLDAAIISADEAVALLPAATPASLYGAVWMPADGYLDPHTATYAVANAARALGVAIETGCRVTAIELGDDRRVRAVVTERGRIETEVVVNAAGMWAPQVSAMVGAFTPSIPVDHQHIAMKAVPGHELPRDTPCFRDPDNLVYGKAETGGLLFGGYEPDPVARWIDGVPWSHSGRSLAPDEERFAGLMEGAVRRFPLLAEAGVVALVCHPDAMTPDANPLLGPVPDVPGFWVAAGLSLNGFGGAGGIGKTLAELITTGESEWDVHAYRPWRFGRAYRDPRFAAATARETYRYYYRLRYPLDSDAWGRPNRLSALHGRLQELGTVFGTKNGWERPDHVVPGEPWRRAEEDQRAFGWTRPPYLDLLEGEHRAFRERAGLIDLSSFGKIEVVGPGASALLEHVADSRLGAVGTVTYTQFLDHRGGIIADVTITRLAADRFRVVTGAGYVDSDLGWLRLQAAATGADVVLRDVSDELSVIGLWGPRARDVLAATTTADVSHAGFPFRAAHAITVGGRSVLAQRITYVGELGWELYVEPRDAVGVWDALVAAGEPHGLRVGGYRVLDALRIEKGYRYMGTDLTPGDTPYEAGIGFCVHLDKGPFIGRDALVARGSAVTRRLRTVLVGDGSYETLYGGEAVTIDGVVVGRVRSCAHAFAVPGTVAYVYLPATVAEGAAVGVEVFDRVVPGRVVADVLFDPSGSRIHC